MSAANRRKRECDMRWSGLVAIVLVAATQSTDLGPTGPAPRGLGHGLRADCTLYFEFLGRTGAGRSDTFAVDPFGMGYCAGLVRGIVESARSSPIPRICMPTDRTIAEVVWVVVRYLDTHPRTLSESDVVLARVALEAAFPCR